MFKKLLIYFSHSFIKRHALIHVAKNLHKCPHCQFSSYRTDKVKEHINRLHTEKPLQLELSEDVQSALLKDADVEVPPLSNLKGILQQPKSKRKKSKRMASKANKRVTSAAVRPILPKS